MSNLIWTWVLVWAPLGQHPLISPYFDTEDSCYAAMQEMVDKSGAELCDVNNWSGKVCVIAGCDPLSKPETHKHQLKEVHDE